MLAVLGAVALVVIAVVVRGMIDGDGVGGVSGDGGPVTVACIVELRDPCRALAASDADVDVVVEAAGTTLDKLTAGATGYDGWVTLDPWPSVAGEDRPAQALGEPTEPIASTELVIVSPDTAEPCAGDVTWRCLGDAGANVGLPDRTGALGLLLVANAASDYFDKVDDLATNDFNEDPQFDGWLDRLTADTTSDPLGDLLLAFPPTLVFDAVGTSRAQVAADVGSRVVDRLVVVAPDPAGRAHVVIAPVRGADGAEAVTELADDAGFLDALTDAGWERGATGSTNLPRAGVLYVLLTR